MKNLTKISSLVAVSSLVPLVVSAQFGSIGGLVSEADMLITVLIRVVMGVALLAFFWGLAKFIFKAGDEKAKDEGKRIMIWGVVAFFVMVSVWGLVRFIQAAFLGNTPLDAPSFQLR